MSASTEHRRVCIHLGGLLTVAALLVAPFARAQMAPPINPVPDREARERAAKKIESIYGRQRVEATNGEQKRRLVRSMLDAADELNEGTPEYFELIRTAHDLAVSAGAVELAFEAVQMLEGAYTLDTRKMREQVILGIAPRASELPDHRALARRVFGLMSAAVDRDDYSTAKKLADVGLASARRIRDGELIRRLAGAQQRIDRLATAYAKVIPSFKRVGEQPDDAQAATLAGKFLALVKEDWPVALPLLARANDQSLLKAAQQELDKPATVEAEIALADRWWEVAAGYRDAERVALLRHAGTWYEQALPKTSGLTRIRLEKRVAAAEEATRGATDFVPPRPRVTRQSVKLNVKEPWPLHVDLRRGQLVRIQAKGRWRVNSGGKWHGPHHPRFYLQGRLDEGQPFRIGSDVSLVAEEDTTLWLGMREGGRYGNNRGDIQVEIEISQ